MYTQAPGVVELAVSETPPAKIRDLCRAAASASNQSPRYLRVCTHVPRAQTEDPVHTYSTLLFFIHLF